ncbi:transcriptional regulator, DeoR family [Desulfovibrio sp. X2]|uniref:sugar-binding transcriptional regulator n=1 Tax=Desulfovibrio sp. X2 TaxID=941449 RepID=UPI000358E1D9|nr:sugar-binding transcriptional regulator [Desulfovibrio sp. X2]EPR44373.1 transcriptional regulator, DeoR family [Desulfovibrio sp. X2]
MDNTPEEQQMLSRIAWAYYVNGMTQAEIASWLGLSRARVVRLLQLCRDEGYVQITVNTDKAACHELERDLESAFGLTRAVVVPAPQNHRHLNTDLGQAAAHYPAGCLRDGNSLGLGWGTTVAAAATSVPPEPAQGLTVVSLYGGLPHSIVVNPYEIVATFSRRLKAAQTYYIAAPMFAPSPEAQRLLKSQELFRAVYAQAIQVDIAFIGLGELDPSATNLVLGAITQQDVRSLKKAGAVGEVFGAFVDPSGRPVDHPRNACFMGPTLEEARDIPLTIAAAGGESKEPIIRAALAGGFVNVLVTDEITAGRLLQPGKGERQ